MYIYQGGLFCSWDGYIFPTGECLGPGKRQYWMLIFKAGPPSLEVWGKMISLLYVDLFWLSQKKSLSFMVGKVNIACAISGAIHPQVTSYPLLLKWECHDQFLMLEAYQNGSAEEFLSLLHMCIYVCGAPHKKWSCAVSYWHGRLYNYYLSHDC